MSFIWNLFQQIWLQLISIYLTYKKIFYKFNWLENWFLTISTNTRSGLKKPVCSSIYWRNIYLYIFLDRRNRANVDIFIIIRNYVLRNLCSLKNGCGTSRVFVQVILAWIEEKKIFWLKLTNSTYVRMKWERMNTVRLSL